jgi:hypothetical protein
MTPSKISNYFNVVILKPLGSAAVNTEPVPLGDYYGQAKLSNKVWFILDYSRYRINRIDRPDIINVSDSGI